MPNAVQRLKGQTSLLIIRMEVVNPKNRSPGAMEASAAEIKKVKMAIATASLEVCFYMGCLSAAYNKRSVALITQLSHSS